MQDRSSQVTDGDWISFPGGELQGRRPRALCPACREALRVQVLGRGRVAPGPGRRGTLCFQCYRAELDRERALRAAADLNTASEERFQTALPFESIDRSRLERLRTERAKVRAMAQQGAGQYVDKRRRAQIVARHALQAIAAGLRARQTPWQRDQELAAAVHAAELQLPEAWLPFVIGR
ncbi:MAG: hypothetical protein ACM3SQ_12095 [Betaproteobacteria bacterium]